MKSDAWKELETRPTFKEWLDEYQGCLICYCGHGCSQWIEEQKCRTAMLFRVMSNPNATTKLDKVTQIPLERIDKIWYRLYRWENARLNRQWNAEAAREKASKLAAKISSSNESGS